MGRAFAATGALTALVGVVLALAQTDVKRLLAYHSISQIGFIVCAWGSALSLGLSTNTGISLLAAAYLHALYHGIFKGTLFLAVGAVSDAAGSRDVYKTRDGFSHLKAQGYTAWIVAAAFFASACSISALPPWNGYISKSILTSMMANRYFYWILAAASAGTVASFIKLSCIFMPSGLKHTGVRDRLKDSGERPSQYCVRQSGLGSHSRMQNVCMSSALILGFVLCIAGGIAGKPVFVAVHRLLSVWQVIQVPPEGLEVLYSVKDLLKTLIITLVGILLFFALRIRQVKGAMAAIRLRERSFAGLFYSFFGGLGILLLYLLVSAEYI